MDISVKPGDRAVIPGKNYDVAIVGGGLAGLALSIQLARTGYSVIVFEKEQYPFHRVCGEYISLESWDFLSNLGVDLLSIKVPIIRKLIVSDIKGRVLEHPLPLGGFGISRYLLDHELAGLARQAGVILEENTRINEISYHESSYSIHSSGQIYNSKIACGCFGKRSNLDIKWKRPFATAQKNKLNNYIGIKYHVEYDFPADTIALHCFKQGYCGLVKVEGDKYNLCYLTTAANLQKSGNNIEAMEINILGQNPQLHKIFSNAIKSEAAPVTISQISFEKKSCVDNHVLMLGDAAGMITPLCGNGMSMALHASKLAAILVDRVLQGRMGQMEMEKEYSQQWEQQFGKRLRMGRRIQRLSLSPVLMNLFIRSGRLFPGLMRSMISKTHGESF